MDRALGIAEAGAPASRIVVAGVALGLEAVAVIDVAAGDLPTAVGDVGADGPGKQVRGAFCFGVAGMEGA